MSKKYTTMTLRDAEAEQLDAIGEALGVPNRHEAFRTVLDLFWMEFFPFAPDEEVIIFNKKRGTSRRFSPVSFKGKGPNGSERDKRLAQLVAVAKYARDTGRTVVCITDFPERMAMMCRLFIGWNGADIGEAKFNAGQGGHLLFVDPLESSDPRYDVPGIDKAHVCLLRGYPHKLERQWEMHVMRDSLIFSGLPGMG